MSSTAPKTFSPNRNLRGTLVALTDADGHYLESAQYYDGAIYTLFGNRFSDATIARMCPEDQVKAWAARPTVRS
jgi:hypothetical protein